jgi:RNA polymerase sigma-54 factor
MAARQANRLVPNQSIRLNQSLSAAIRILRFDAAGLTRYLEEQAAENPCLSLQTYEPPAHDWAPKWHRAFSPAASAQEALTDQIAAPAPGLMAHVMAEIGRLIPSGPSRLAAGVFVMALEPSGWLGRPLQDLAGEAGISLAAAKTLLSRLQQMEPTGLFARSLAECLQLQAAEAGYLDGIMACLLQNLPLVATGDTARLARLCNTGEDQILLCLRQLRSFDPKPGSRFVQGAAPVREPDLRLVRSGKGWALALNRSALPDIVIGQPGDQTAAPDREKLASAKALDRLVKSRNETLLTIANAIFTRQPEVPDRGLEHLRAMTMADIADDLGYHESTISRAVAGVSVDTPVGVLWLRSLFSTPPAEGGGLPAAALRAQLARLIAEEDPCKPHSDQRLSELLSSPGAPLARRTVAKYRSMLNIAPAHRRKLQTGPKPTPKKRPK